MPWAIGSCSKANFNKEHKRVFQTQLVIWTWINTFESWTSGMQCCWWNRPISETSTCDSLRTCWTALKVEGRFSSSKMLLVKVLEISDWCFLQCMQSPFKKILNHKKQYLRQKMFECQILFASAWSNQQKHRIRSRLMLKCTAVPDLVFLFCTLCTCENMESLFTHSAL